MVQQVRALGMPLYFAQPPTGYADTADAWVNTGALVNRMNFAIDLTANRVSGVRVDLAALTGTHRRRARQDVGDAHLLRGQASDTTSATLARAPTCRRSPRWRSAHRSSSAASTQQLPRVLGRSHVVSWRVSGRRTGRHTGSQRPGGEP